MAADPSITAHQDGDVWRWRSLAPDGSSYPSVSGYRVGVSTGVARTFRSKHTND